MMNWCVGRKGI